MAHFVAHFAVFSVLVFLMMVRSLVNGQSADVNIAIYACSFIYSSIHSSMHLFVFHLFCAPQFPR